MKRFTRSMAVALAAVAVWYGSTTPAAATQTITYGPTWASQDFAVSGWGHNGVDWVSAPAYAPTFPGSALRLTEPTTNRSGQAYLAQTLPLGDGRSFSSAFSFRITDSYGNYIGHGADGFAFVIAGTDAPPNDGAPGGCLGYGKWYTGSGSGIFGPGDFTLCGINGDSFPHSIGIEFDTWGGSDFMPGHVGDEGYNHVGIDLNGNLISVVKADVDAWGQLVDGNVWYAWIDYDGTTLEVRVARDNNRPALAHLSYPVDLASLLARDEVYLGFTAGTGGEWGAHQILTWTLSYDTYTYTLTSSAGANGTISPSATVDHGGSSTFTITPAAGYHVQEVLVDGGSVGAVTSYTFSNVTADHTIAASFAADNRAPDVSAAAPSIASIWPPNNKMVAITVNGVTDPDGDAVTITVTGITNNETGSADAGGIGTSTAQVRASRNGKGAGRTYTISFTAADGKGGISSGSVTVVVPHDQGGELADDDHGDDHHGDRDKAEKKDEGKKGETKAEKKGDDKNKKTAKAPAKRAKPTAVETATWGEVKNSQQ